jgi:PAS domain S-box-containing protein
MKLLFYFISPYFFIVSLSAQEQTSNEGSSLSSYNIPLWVIIAVLFLQMLVIAFLIINVRKRKATEEDLLESQGILQDVLDTIPVRVFWKDRDSVFLGGNVQLANSADEDSISDIIGKTDTELSWSAHADKYRADDREVMETGQPKLNYEEMQITLTGREFWLKTSKIPLRNSKGEVYGVLGTCEDITHQITVQKELRENERQLRLINTNIPGVVYQFFAKDSGEWGVRYVSERSEEILGLDSSLQNYVERFIERVHQDDRQAFVESIELVVAEELPWQFDGRFIKPNGEIINFRANSTPSRGVGELVFYGIIFDTTEKMKIAEQLHHSDKMKAVGQLAGGIAHDFNNMLGAIIASAEVLEKYIKGEERAEKFQKIILESAAHAAELTKNLLRFSRKKPVTQADSDLNKILADVGSILTQTIDKRILVNLDAKATRSIVNGDASQLQSALLNLGINASHAMAAGGIINLSSKDRTLSAAYCKKSRFDLRPGEYVEIEIRDDGSGIEEADLEHIFEPFFTTKSRGQGTGLGLSAVYGTIQQHKGEITVSTIVDEGSSFQILLPLVKQEKVKDLPSAVEHKGQGKVLLVDDERVMRITAEALLHSFGYEVILAENGQEGLETFASSPDSVKLVVLDMMMPEMNGKDCFMAIRKIRPDIPVILASGFSGENDLKQMKKAGLNYFLQKPYDRNALAQALDKVLGS